jgi:hypothetical protein
MMDLSMTGWQMALWGIILGLASTRDAAAQTGPVDAGEAGECTPSPQPHDQCPERCPTYDTCYIEEELQLYYRVDDERFPCEGLDCKAASVTLADYCCQRGEYEPARGGGGGCACALGRAGSALRIVGVI